MSNTALKAMFCLKFFTFNQLNKHYYIEGLLAVCLLASLRFYQSANAITIGVVRLTIGSIFLYFLTTSRDLKHLIKKNGRLLSGLVLFLEPIGLHISLVLSSRPLVWLFFLFPHLVFT